MWSRWLTGISLVSVAAVSAIASEAAYAQLAREYFPSEFCEVLYGFGYNVPPECSSLEAPLVRQAIREFQARYDLTVDGIAGTQTQTQAAELMQILKHNLNLVVRPDPLLVVDQFYDDRTLDAVRTYQRRNRLPETGIATLLDVRQPLDVAAKEAARRSPQPPPSTPVSGVPYESVVEFRAALIGLGYDIPPTGALADEPTRKAIEGLQRQYGLLITGAADPETQAMVARLVRTLQNNLNIVLAPSPNLSVSQFYTSQTRTAVERFQRNNTLPVTGIATQDVRRILDEQAKEKVQ